MSPVRCIACGRVIGDGEMMYRFPSDYPSFADMVFSKHNQLRGIDNPNIVLPDFCGEDDRRISKTVVQNGKKCLITPDGRILERMICPSCHTNIYRGTSVDELNSVVVFGMPESGKTSLVLSLAKETTQLGYDIDNDTYICLMNDQCCNAVFFKRDMELLEQNKKPLDVREPVMIHRSYAVSTGLTDRSDVFYDTADKDMESEASAEQLVSFGHNANRFLFTIRLKDIACCPDEAARETMDLTLRQELYKLYFLAQYSDRMPELILVLTMADELIGSSNEGSSGFWRDNINDGDALKRYFTYRYRQSCEVIGNFSGFRVCAVSSRIPDLLQNGVNSIVDLYKMII